MSAVADTARTVATACPRCRKPLTLPVSTGDAICPSCQRPFSFHTFAPPMRRAARASDAGVGPSATAVCGNHPGNAASQGCSRCGMFICNLCEITTDGMTLCPSCYDRLSAEGSLSSTRTRFRDMAGLAATSIAAGIFLWFLMALTGPLAIGYTVKAFRQRRELENLYSPVRLWILLILGVCETLGGLFMIVALVGAIAKL